MGKPHPENNGDGEKQQKTLKKIGKKRILMCSEMNECNSKCKKVESKRRKKYSTLEEIERNQNTLQIKLQTPDVEMYIQEEKQVEKSLRSFTKIYK